MPDYNELLAIADASPSCEPPTAEEIAEDAMALEREICRRLEIDVLGEWDCGSIEVYSAANAKIQRVRNIDQIGRSRLLQLCGAPARDCVIDGQFDAPGMFKVGDVRNAIGIIAGGNRLTHRSLLGVGCWRGQDIEGLPRNEIVLVGDSEAANWNGKEKLEHIEHPRHGGLLLGIDAAEPWYDFAKLAGNLDAAGERKWCESAVDSLAAEFARWRWEHDATPMLLAGLVMASYLQTLWEWRPQVALTGQTNSGKSYLFKTLKGIFGNLAYDVTAQSTAAGIRQGLANSAMVPILDEWDKSKSRGEILTMIRTSSRRDRRATGTQDQRGIELNMQHIFWVAGIDSGLQDEADQNRFIRIETLKPLASMRNRLQMRPESQLRELGQRALAVAVRHGVQAVEMASALKETQIDGVDGRHIESYAVPAAMLACAGGLSMEQAATLLEQLAATAGDKAEPEADEQTLLTAILSAYADGGRELGRKSVGYLLEMASRHSGEALAARDALAQAGIATREYGGREYLAIAAAPVKSHLLRDNWRTRDINQVLSRCPGAVAGQRRKFAGTVHRCVLVPLEEIRTANEDEAGEGDSF